MINPPVSFAENLGPFPDGAELVRPDAGEFEIAVCFVKTLDLMAERFESMRVRVAPRGSIWLGWPLSAAETDITFNKVQAMGLTAGMVDNKATRLDPAWNGLRFVVRPQNRPTWPNRAVVYSQYSNDRGSRS